MRSNNGTKFSLCAASRTEESAVSEAIVVWLQSTAVSHAMKDLPWLWPVCETLHFIGLALLVGAAGVFDLRLLGFLKSIPLSAAMQMRGWAAVGIAINVVTGVLFFVGAPDQYIDNPAWWAKVLFLFVATVNIALFETTQGARMLALTAEEETPTSFKVAGAVSIASWAAVLYFGRMLPFIGNAF
jgi:hypothetical protein